jgi:hypothetical protein
MRDVQAAARRTHGARLALLIHGMDDSSCEGQDSRRTTVDVPGHCRQLEIANARAPLKRLNQRRHKASVRCVMWRTGRMKQLERGAGWIDASSKPACLQWALTGSSKLGESQAVKQML